MKSTSKEDKNKIDTVDYVSALNNIKQGVMVMNPSSGTTKNLLESRDDVDNAAWVDFSEIRFFIEPPLPPTSDKVPEVTLSSEDENLLNDIDSNEGDAQNYLTGFYLPFKNAVFRGVLFNIIFKCQEKRYTNVLQVGRIIYAQVHFSFGPVPMAWDVDKIVNSLTTGYLLFDYLEKMSRLYFSVVALNSSDSRYTPDAFFKEIEDWWFKVGDIESLWQLYTELSGTTIFSFPESKSIPGPHWALLVEHLVNKFGAAVATAEAEEAYTFKPPVPIEYPFDPFPFLENNFNLGLRLIYRQEWRPLGTQPGEVVRTIPLGPKQSEKVSTKIVRRRKVVRTSENLKSEESTTETSDSSKDSSEIVKEAASAMKWNVNLEVEGSYNTLLYHVGGKLSSGLAGESSESSKNASSHLSETMRKTVNKVRMESKVVVSTEFEETFETTSASEIQNPNDEIAITYIYSKLQMQYEILTRLAEVQDVVMVAEELVPAEKIDFEWVKRHDWIIAKVLLDDSFREALNSISQEVAQHSPSIKTIKDDLGNARTTTITALNSFAGTANNVSAESIDFVQESQKSYTTTAKEYIESLRQNYLLDAKRYRLYEHIRENILHYSRAIWQQEDPQQRMLRYRKRGISIPLNWYFHPDIEGPWTIDDSGLNYPSNIKGKYVADMNGPMLPVTDLINPAGPIAFYGNYAVYYMRPEYAKDNSIMPLLEIFKSPYLYNGELMDPVQIEYEKKCATGEIPVNNAVIDKDKCYEDMIDYVPELRLKYLKALKTLPDDEKEIDALELLDYDYPMFIKFYPEYLFRKEQTRRFLLDTNCLKIDLLPGEGSALEPFKQMHRAIDVLKAEQERLKLDLENVRRQKLIEAGKFGDPDIEKVTVVSSDASKLVDMIAGIESSNSSRESKEPLNKNENKKFQDK